MGDLATDTALRPCGDGRFEATLSADWEIWGPMGGYVAACALRAAGAATRTPRPGVVLVPLPRVARVRHGRHRASRRGKRGGRPARTASTITQGGRADPRRAVWSVGDNEGLEHDETDAARRARPRRACRASRSCCPTTRRRPSRSGSTSTPSRSTSRADWPPDGPRPARWQEWLRFLPDGDVRRPVGRRRALRDPRRPAELAVGQPPPRVEAAAVHRADARPERGVPPPDHRP